MTAAAVGSNKTHDISAERLLLFEEDEGCVRREFLARRSGGKAGAAKTSCSNPNATGVPADMLVHIIARILPVLGHLQP